MMRKYAHPIMYVVATLLVIIMIELGAMCFGLVLVGHSVNEMELMQSYFYGRRGD